MNVFTSKYILIEINLEQIKLYPVNISRFLSNNYFVALYRYGCSCLVSIFMDIYICLQDINKNFEFEKEVGIERKQVASLAAQPFRNTELYMHVTIMHQPIANC